MDILFGSICLSDIPKELIKDVELRDGRHKKYLSVSVLEMKQPGKYGDTHFISCAPKKDERKEGMNYIIGNLRRWEEHRIEPQVPINDDDLPF